MTTETSTFNFEEFAQQVLHDAPFDQGLVLYIPRIYPRQHGAPLESEELTVRRVEMEFAEQGLGIVGRVDLQRKCVGGADRAGEARGEMYYQAFVHFEEWFGTPENRMLQFEILQGNQPDGRGGKIPAPRLHLEDGGFWVLLPKRAPSTEAEARKQRHHVPSKPAVRALEQPPLVDSRRRMAAEEMERATVLLRRLEREGDDLEGLDSRDWSPQGWALLEHARARLWTTGTATQEVEKVAVLLRKLEAGDCLGVLAVEDWSAQAWEVIEHAREHGCIDPFARERRAAIKRASEQAKAKAEVKAKAKAEAEAKVKAKEAGVGWWARGTSTEPPWEAIERAAAIHDAKVGEAARRARVLAGGRFGPVEAEERQCSLVSGL
jgi:hypothetical protein